MKCNRSTAAAAAACENRQSTATVAEMDRRTGQTDQLHTVSGSSMRLFNEPPKWLVMRCMRLHKIVNKSSPHLPPFPLSQSSSLTAHSFFLSFTSPASFSLLLSFFAFTVESLRSAANAFFAAAATDDSKSDTRFFNTRLLWLKYFTTYITTHTVRQSHVKAIKLPRHTHSRTHSFAFLINFEIKKSQ